MADTLLDRLRRTRPGYDAECRWHRFLVDAYTGCGGFEGGRIAQPITSYWGPGAEVYAASGLVGASMSGLLQESYLDQFRREDGKKFASRCASAVYLNYVEALTDLKCSYMLRKPFNRNGEPTELTDWRADIDGQGTSWDDVRPLLAVNAAILGWTPLLIDRPSAPEGMSRGQAAAEGLDRFIVRQLAPANLLEWEERDGRFAWAKVKTSRTERNGWGDRPTQVDEYSIWTPTEVERYEVRSVENGDPVVGAPVVVPHPFGRVPVAVFRHKRLPGRSSCVAGLPMHAQISKVARRLFNLTSEFDEHIRGQVFAVLVVVMRGATQAGDVNIGVDNGLPIDPDAKNTHYYLAPPGSIATTLEKRIEATVQEIYRMGRTEYTRPAGGVTSAESRRYEFASTNRAIGDFAGEFARGETETGQLVGRAAGVSEERLRSYSVGAPTDFDVEDLASDIQAATDALALQLGPTATATIKARVVERMLPNLSPEQRKQIVGELERLAAQPPPTPPAPIPPGPVPPTPPT